MKVLFFSDTYLPNRDGVVSAMQGLAQEYARRGIETFIFSSGSRKDRKSNTDRRVRYFTSVPFLPYPQYKVALFPHGALAPAKKIRPDVIHSHALATMALGAAYCAQSMGVPSVATFHTKVTDATHYVSKNKLVSGALQEFGWAYFRWLLGRFDIVTAPSIETCKELESHGIKCVAAPNGVDTKRFSPAGAKASLGLDSGKAVKVLFVGRIVKEKNIGFLFEVAKRMEKNRQEALFVIAGKGPALGYFMEKAKAEGLA
ncbi:MAG TPA: glycosyltransferase, partial [Candidatus Micrarchaeota archaeon]|nr:glycosyltransferase [Candidatus Micrarchaeota archaeon]